MIAMRTPLGVRERIGDALNAAKAGDRSAVWFLRRVLIAEIGTNWTDQDVIALVALLESLPPVPEVNPGPVVPVAVDRPKPRWWQRVLLAACEPWRWFVGLLPVGWVTLDRCDEGPGLDALDEVCPDCGGLECCCDEISF